jgi:hypothetical protein
MVVMTRVRIAACGSAVLVSLLVAALRPEASSRAQATPGRGRERPVPFQVGETLTYDVSWSAYLTAGTAVLTVKEKRPSYNSIAYYIVAEGRPSQFVSALYPLYFKMDTLIDAFTLLPQRGSTYSEEGARHKFRTTTFDRAARKAHFEFQTDTIVKKDFSVPPDVQDALSVLYALRMMPLKAGSRTTMPVTDDGGTYTLQVDVGAPERIRTPEGEARAWKLQPSIRDDQNEPVGRNIAVWLSDDSKRLPLKMQADLVVGSFVLTLRDAN